MAAFTIEARDGSSDALAGVLETARGDVRTPAFVPLATKATVKGLLWAEVAESMAPGEVSSQALISRLACLFGVFRDELF
jgi:tRNA-guanine family transglycosylase